MSNYKLVRNEVVLPSLHFILEDTGIIEILNKYTEKCVEVLEVNGREVLVMENMRIKYSRDNGAV